MTQTSESVGTSRQLFPWLVVAWVIILAAGGFFWMDRKIEALQATSDQRWRQGVKGTDLQDVRSAQQKLNDQMNDIQQKLASEGTERKAIADQLGALGSRVDALASANAESSSTAAPQAQKNRRGRR